MQGLAKFTGSKPAPTSPVNDYVAPKVTDAKQPASAMNFTDPLQFWEILSTTSSMKIHRPGPGDGRVGEVQPLGMKLGKRWDCANVDPIVLKAMERAAQDIGPMLSDLPFGQVVNGWLLRRRRSAIRKRITQRAPSSLASG